MNPGPLGVRLLCMNLWAKAFVSLLALLHLANVAQCCCGHYCLKPNEVCGAAECPLKATQEQGGSC